MYAHIYALPMCCIGHIGRYLPEISHFVHYISCTRGHLWNRKILNRYRGESKILMSRPMRKNVCAPLKANDLERNAVRCSESTYENISLFGISSLLEDIASNIHNIDKPSWPIQRSKSSFNIKSIVKKFNLIIIIMKFCAS